MLQTDENDAKDNAKLPLLVVQTIWRNSLQTLPMKEKLSCSNTVSNFWSCTSPLATTLWNDATQRAISELGFFVQSRKMENIDSLNAWILSESQFGPNPWKISSTKRLYYTLKPYLPRNLTKILRRFYGNWKDEISPLKWPIEDRYVNFLWETMRQLLIIKNVDFLEIKNFWPDHYRYAFTLTHDIETIQGQAKIRQVMDLEERFGFRSSFNFVPERYVIDKKLFQEIQERGFEIGIHGLKHDGKLFFSRSIFEKRAKKINHYLKKYDAVGFRSPLTHRNPYWMQLLDIDYDLSFFDTDPFEPLPGGTMSIWPFKIGNFIELPYTLPQDYTVIDILGETSPKIRLEKVNFMKKNH